MKSTVLKFLMTTILVLGMAESAVAQRHLKMVYETEPTGPNETFFVRLVFVEHDTDIAGYQLRVGYDKSRGSFTAITNNLGPGGAGSGAVFTIGPDELPLTGVSYADTFRKILLDTSANILPPSDPETDFNLGRLEFVTSATYDPNDGKFGIYLESDTSRSGVWDGNVVQIAVDLISLPPNASVSDWSMY